LNTSTKNMGVGVVVQDEEGEVLAAMAKVVPYVTDPIVAEVVAVWRAINLCCVMGFQRLVFEGARIPHAGVVMAS
jgi:hypothetical protein